MLSSIPQDAFDAGIVREVEGQRIPANGAYDIVDGLLDDDLAVYRRGGGAYLSSGNTAETILGLTSLNLTPGERTLYWGATQMGVLRTASETPTVLNATGVPFALARPGVVAGFAVYPVAAGTDGAVTYYAGSTKTAAYTTGTLTVTNGSRNVTGVGTAWLANVDAGMILTIAGPGVGIVASVDTNTTLTLRDPWPGTTTAGAIYNVRPVYGSFVLSITVGARPYVTAAGSRLLVAGGSRVYESTLSDPYDLPLDNYVELPGAGTITGIQGIGTSALVFSTDGTWRVNNIPYDLTDAAGNVQQSVDRVAEAVLWGDAGVASWRGATIIPTIEDVYLFQGEMVPLSTAIRPLYREYVQEGYQPGLASVHRSHYFLPIVDDTNTHIDTLVCRLDASTPAWIRWSGYSGTSNMFANRIGTTTRSPKLVAVNTRRVTNLSDCFVPSATNKNEPDASTHQLTVITRDFTTRRTGANLWKYLRARLELEDAGTDNPYLSLEYQVGSRSSAWTTVSGNAPESDGTDDFEWNPDDRAQAIRFRIKSNGPTAKCVLRSLEVFFRPSAKR